MVSAVDDTGYLILFRGIGLIQVGLTMDASGISVPLKIHHRRPNKNELEMTVLFESCDFGVP